MTSYEEQQTSQNKVPSLKQTYEPEASVLEPVRPLGYDTYLYDDQALQPMDDYYYDYYDALPDFSALKAPKPSVNKKNGQVFPELKVLSCREIVYSHLTISWF